MHLPFQFDTIDPAIRQELLTFEAGDGFPLAGILYRPPRGDPADR